MIAGRLPGWAILPSILLGEIAFISSSGTHGRQNIQTLTNRFPDPSQSRPEYKNRLGKISFGRHVFGFRIIMLLCAGLAWQVPPSSWTMLSKSRSRV